MDERDGGSGTDWLGIMNDARRRYWEEHGENAAGAGKDREVVNAAVEAVVRERETTVERVVVERERARWRLQNEALREVVYELAEFADGTDDEMTSVGTYLVHRAINLSENPSVFEREREDATP